MHMYILLLYYRVRMNRISLALAFIQALGPRDQSSLQPIQIRLRRDRL